MPTTTCPRCGGTGKTISPATLVKRRLKANVSQREVAAKMGISYQYLSDLERGRKAWNAELLAAFNRAVPEE